MDTIIKVIVIAIIAVGIVWGIWFEYRPDDKTDDASSGHDGSEEVDKQN